MTKAEEKEFKRQIRDTQEIATMLGYDPNRIKKFALAKTEIELENMLISARHAS